MQMPPSPPAHVRSSETIDVRVQELARLPAVFALQLCDREIAQALRQWQMAEATAWQRVKLRLRRRHGLAPRVNGTEDDV